MFLKNKYSFSIKSWALKKQTTKKKLKKKITILRPVAYNLKKELQRYIMISFYKSIYMKKRNILYRRKTGQRKQLKYFLSYISKKKLTCRYFFSFFKKFKLSKKRFLKKYNYFFKRLKLKIGAKQYLKHLMRTNFKSKKIRRQFKTNLNIFFFSFKKHSVKKYKYSTKFYQKLLIKWQPSWKLILLKLPIVQNHLNLLVRPNHLSVYYALNNFNSLDYFILDNVSNINFNVNNYCYYYRFNLNQTQFNN